MSNLGKARRQDREARALVKLKSAGAAGCSALQLGTAAVLGERSGKVIPIEHRQQIGLFIAVKLVRRRLATATRDNRFLFAH